MKRIFVCSPLRGDYEKNQEAARHFCHWVVNQGHAPFAPHIFFTQFLDDDIETERHLGIAAGLEFLRICDELWVFGKPTEGMQYEIAQANHWRIPVRHVKLGET